MKKSRFFISGLIMLSVLFFFCRISYVSGDSPIQGWKIEFWQLNPIQGDYTTIAPGDTMIISWIQELKSIPFNKQYSWAIGDTTGVHKTLYISIDDIISIISPDSTQYQCKYKRTVSLLPGSWALVMYTQGKNGMWSKHSKAYWFRVVSYPPMGPIEINLIVK